ncbi:HD domain-containing protein [Komagataeibacter diospyri]|uniref:HD domain-containing protein n=1 Tax=Komagataeibacter diospyri TaxID=1932662 RepID=UPI001D05060C|nr:HD domain-containing protein [Komagataeibacter diospyri]
MSRADAFAEAAHASIGQTHKYSDDPYIVPPRCVARMVAQTGARDEVVAAALLHDVVEDTPVTLADIKAAFGADVATLVKMVTDVSCPADGNGRRRKTMDQTIKLADQIDNTASITRHDPGFARVYMHEKEGTAGCADPRGPRTAPAGGGAGRAIHPAGVKGQGKS